MNDKNDVNFYNNPLLAMWQQLYVATTVLSLIFFPILLCIGFVQACKKLRSKHLVGDYKREKKFWKDRKWFFFFTMLYVTMLYLTPLSHMFGEGQLRFAIMGGLELPGILMNFVMDPSYATHVRELGGNVPNSVIDDGFMTSLWVFLIPISYYGMKLVLKVNGSSNHGTWVPPNGWVDREAHLKPQDWSSAYSRKWAEAKKN